MYFVYRIDDGYGISFDVVYIATNLEEAIEWTEKLNELEKIANNAFETCSQWRWSNVTVFNEFSEPFYIEVARKKLNKRDDLF